MNCLLGLMLLVACTYAMNVVKDDHLQDSGWHLWKSTHGKSYAHLAAERVRYEIWQDNLRRIEEHNKGDHSYTLGMNHFGDLTNTEFREMVNTYKKPANRTGSTFLKPNGLQIPEDIDWNKKGYVTPVKNQGHCGSCWAFSTTGSLEGQTFKKTGKLVSLSEQNLVDCSSSFGNHGCNGGLMDYAFEYIKANGGIDTEASYPYLGKQQASCHFKKENIGATVAGFTDIPSGDEEGLTNALASVGPISVAIDASHFSFQFYRDGVYDEDNCSSEELDHGVLATGYGVWQVSHSYSKPYYWVKNSWGPGWGVKGFIRMSRNKDNQCGIATAASYPIV